MSDTLNKGKRAMFWTSEVGNRFAILEKPSVMQKIEVMIEVLTTAHLFAHGGYPYDHEHIGGHVVVAELDDSKERGRTLLRKYPFNKLVKWYDDTVLFLLDNLDDEAYVEGAVVDFASAALESEYAYPHER